MAYLLAFVLLVHGLLHLAGFSKAFEIGIPVQLKLNISRTGGVIWLLVAFLFATASLTLLLEKEYWWVITIAAVLLSQVLVIVYWHDARFGTVINVVLVTVLIPSVAVIRFEGKFEKDVASHLAHHSNVGSSLLTESDIQDLPEPVKKYIRHSGAVGQEKVENFKVAFTGKIRKDESSEWMPFTSVQYNFLHPPARLFFMNATMKHLPVAGYHSYEDGTAFMDIRLLSLPKVQYQSGPEMNIAETVTFFNDMVCMAPATLIDKRIKWDSVTERKVHASFTINAITISAWLYFNDQDELVNFVSDDRYAAQEDGTMKKLRWSTPIQSYKEINGHLLGTEARTLYRYQQGDFCYGTFSLTNVEYNVGPN